MDQIEKKTNQSFSTHKCKKTPNLNLGMDSVSGLWKGGKGHLQYQHVLNWGLNAAVRRMVFSTQHLIAEIFSCEEWFIYFFFPVN